MFGETFFIGWRAIFFRGFGPSESALSHEGLLLGIATQEEASPKVMPKVSSNLQEVQKAFHGSLDLICRTSPFSDGQRFAPSRTSKGYTVSFVIGLTTRLGS
jgi:hypothetical protein